MSEPFRILFLAVAGAWTAALAVAILLLRRAGWERALAVAPVVDLLGTWAGAVAALALLLGRSGYGFAWAAALLLVCLMVTISLYDRAVLMPSLEAARKRLRGGGEKWEGEWRFLWRLAAWGRAATLLCGAGALVCGALA